MGIVFEFLPNFLAHIKVIMTQDIYHECFLLELTVSYTIRKWHRKGNMFNKNHPGNYTKLQIYDKFWFKSIGKFTMSS